VVGRFAASAIGGVAYARGEPRAGACAADVAVNVFGTSLPELAVSTLPAVKATQD
jgi:hypothetical protein